LSALLGALLWVAPALAQPAGQAAEEQGLSSQARAHPDSAYQHVTALAVEEWDAGHSAEARALFLLAHELKPSARTLRALGMTAFELRLYPVAVRELAAALADSRQPLDANMRREVQGLLARAQVFVGRYRIQLEPRGAQLRVDGAKSALESDGTLLLGLGRHTLQLEAPGYRSQSFEIQVHGSAGESLTLRLSPEAGSAVSSGAAVPLPRPVPPASGGERKGSWRNHLWSLSLAASSVVVGSTSLALRLRARKEDQQLEDFCAGHACDPRDDLTHKRENLVLTSWITLGGAGLLAVGAVVGYCIERRRQRAPQAARRRGAIAFGLSELTLRF
jgi:hypothetical protein